jgi:serine/threonine protein kinase
VEKIGQGGMGEVYLADDTTLDRKVALKFLPEVFTDDPERMARFEREAKLLASLNHTNIAGIYGLEQDEGNRFLVLEYVEGETLRARLSKGALSLEDALALCRQIAEGLEAAHEKGVIHRDLKPANVMITTEEKVKILDFGLAKALADESQNVDPSDSPTITNAMTRPGVVLGTAAYMSPEQAKGKRVDKRADIWAFGCILYECLTGKKAFEGETVTETLAAILRGDPDWDALPSTIPRNIQFVLRKCLEKDRNRRFRDPADVQIEIEELRELDESIITAEQSRSWLWKIVAVVFIIAFVFVSFIHFREKPTDTIERVIFQDRLPENIRLGGMGTFALSPDGHQLAFSGISSDGIQQLYLRSMDSLEVRPLIGTKNYKIVMDFFWSPDSRYIAFIADEGKLRKIDIVSGSVTTICELPDEFYSGIGSWNGHGEILLSDYPPDRCIVRVSSSGAVIPVTTPNKERQELRHTDPVFLPDGRHVNLPFRSTLVCS